VPIAASRLLVLAAIGAALFLAACGGASDDELVRETVQRYAKASAEKDYQEICDEIVAKELIRSVESVGLPCELAFKRGLGPVKEPKVRVDDVQVNKTKALVRVHSTAKNQPASDDTLELVLQGGSWRISSLAKAQPQPPTTTSP